MRIFFFKYILKYVILKYSITLFYFILFHYNNIINRKLVYTYENVLIHVLGYLSLISSIILENKPEPVPPAIL